MKKRIRRDAAKATVEHTIDALAPGLAEQVMSKAKTTIGQVQARLNEVTHHPEIVIAGHTLEVEGKLEEIVGRVKVVTANAADHVKTAAADAAEHVKATGEQLSEKFMGQPKQS